MGTTGDGWEVSGDLVANGGFRQLYVFSQANCTASQTDASLTFATGNDAAILTLPLIRSGSVTGVAAYSESARTAGSCTVTATVNGVGCLVCPAIDATNTQTVTTTVPKDTHAVASGGNIGVEITTTADWATAGGTPSLTVVVEVEQ